MPCKTRREFLVEGGCGLFTIAALGLSIDAAALPVSVVEGEGGQSERSYPIPVTDGVNVDREAQVILVRYQNKVFAMALACPHENAAVRWLPKDQRFQCTRHDSKYTPQGAYMSGRATRNLDRFPIRRADTSVIVTMDRVYHSDREADAWNAAVVDVSL
jgi:Rieske Fe-S protein